MPWDDDPGWIRDPVAMRGLRMIGAAVLRARTERGLSQAQLAAITGIHQSTISRLENGQRFGLRWWRFAILVATLGGLDFGRARVPSVTGIVRIAADPTYARQQLDAIEAEVLRMREGLDLSGENPSRTRRSLRSRPD